MHWEIRLDLEKQYAEVTTHGIADGDGSMAMVKALLNAIEGKSIKYTLIDHRAIQQVIGDTLGVYNRPKKFTEMGVDHSVKIAEVVNPEHREFFNFLKLVCINRGFRFSIFNDTESALKWLFGSERP